jgi:hypothetical protein
MTPTECLRKRAKVFAGFGVCILFYMATAITSQAQQPISTSGDFGFAEVVDTMTVGDNEIIATVTVDNGYDPENSFVAAQAVLSIGSTVVGTAGTLDVEYESATSTATSSISTGQTYTLQGWYDWCPILNFGDDDDDDDDDDDGGMARRAMATPASTGLPPAPVSGYVCGYWPGYLPLTLQAGVPSIASISPTYGTIGDSSKQISVTGQNLQDELGVSNVNITGGVTASVSSPGADNATVTYSIPMSATAGSQQFTMSNSFGTSSPVTFQVDDPSPNVTGISPSTWYAGNSYSVTITGTNFGTNPSLSISAQGVTFTQSAGATDTQITANVTVAADAPNGNATVQVTSTGFGGGNGFYPGSSGNSPSNSSTAANVAAVTPPPQIIFNGGNISGSTQSVVAGQQIVLSVATPSGYSIQSQSWSFSNQSAISGGFVNTVGSGAPSATSGGQEAADPALNQNTLTFYWVNPQDNGETVTCTYTLNNGQSAGATATFNIGGPTGNLLLTPNMITGTGSSDTGVQVLAGPKLSTTGIPLGTSQVGITFNSNATPPSGNNQSFTWIQIIGGVQNQYINSTGQFATPSSPETGIDNTYPYANASSTATNDTPSSALPSIYGEGWESFTATMFLMWDPALPNGCTPASTNPITLQSTASTCTSIPIPLSSVTWHWSGCAINTLANQTNGTTWSLSTGSGCPVQTLGTVQSAGFPTWTSQVVRSY